MWRVYYVGEWSLFPQKLLAHNGFPKKDSVPYFDRFFCSMLKFVSSCHFFNSCCQLGKKVLNSFSFYLSSVFNTSLANMKDIWKLCVISYYGLVNIIHGFLALKVACQMFEEI